MDKRIVAAMDTFRATQTYALVVMVVAFVAAWLTHFTATTGDWRMPLLTGCMAGTYAIVAEIAGDR